jgi:nucleotide-binding universal stress UspA family protein
MYDKIVVPLDGSELAEGVIPHVAELVRDRASQVCLLAVASTGRRAPPVLADLLSSAAGTQEEKQRVEQELTAYLDTVAEKLEPVVNARVSVRFGQPADEILALASEVDAGLIVMSTHGRSGIRQWVFGTVADRILHGASCPLLLVRTTTDQAKIAYQRILVPLDGSETAEQILPYVGALIRLNHTRVFLVSVLTNGLSDRTVALLTSIPAGLRLSTTSLPKAEVQLRAYMRSVAAALRERGAFVQIDIRRGSPADEILTHAAEVDADLIAMTTHGLSGPSRWVYGDVAGKVLHSAQRPVLLVRPTAREQKSER